MTYDEAKKEINRIISEAPSFPKLRKAYLSFLKSTGDYYPEKSAVMARELEPKYLLIAHSSVMDAKSQRCKTLKALADQVFQETGLPRKPRGDWRGQDGVDIAAFINQFSSPENQFPGNESRKSLIGLIDVDKLNDDLFGDR